MADEGLRKLFVRQGWSIGKTASQNICPECSAAARGREEAKPPPPAQTQAPSPDAELAADRVRSQAWAAHLWKNLHDLGRRALLDTIVAALTEQERLDLVESLMVAAAMGRAPEPAVPAGAPAPPPAEPEPAPEAADWWQEMMGSGR
jgi:hypothetical protein